MDRAGVKVSTPADVTGVHVDDDGILASCDTETVLDVMFDDRRIWSFWLHRDGVRRGHASFVSWPPALRHFLHGVTDLRLVEHVTQHEVYAEMLRFGGGQDRVAVVNERGLPLGIDKSLRLVQTFDTRSAEHVAPLLDSIEKVLADCRAAGVESFVVYGTLLGAVRGGKLIGHDSDADLGYVSRHTHPVDVIRESFDLQRELAAMGYAITRYSGGAFKVDVTEADGSIRGLDVFGGFLLDGYLHLMGEIRTPFQADWIFPLGTCTLEGRELPAPADTDKFLTATYGPTWRVPDPAYHFGTPESTHRRLTGWFRGTRVNRADWDRTYSGTRLSLPDLEPSSFARWVHDQEPDADRIIDLGCGRGVDALWYARQGVPTIGLDYVTRGSNAVAELAADEQLDLSFRFFNLDELRSVLSGSARVAQVPGPKILTARHLVDATDIVGRANLWRACDMMLRAGGRAYFEFVVRRGEDRFLEQKHLHAVPLFTVVDELKVYGAHIVSSEVRSDDVEPGGRRTARLVIEWPTQGRHR